MKSTLSYAINVFTPMVGFPCNVAGLLPAPGLGQGMIPLRSGQTWAQNKEKGKLSHSSMMTPRWAKFHTENT